MTKASQYFNANRAAILAAKDAAEFIEQFAPTTPRRRAEFEAKLATLIDGHCLVREAAALKDAELVTAKTLGAKGGEKGGPARARSLSREQRVVLAVRAARARWHGERTRQAEAAELIRGFHAKRGRLPSRRAIAKHFGCSTSSAARYLKAAESLNAPAAIEG